MVVMTKEYFKSLDAAITAYMCGDSAPIRLHSHIYIVPIPNDDEALRVAVYKVVTARTSMPMDLRIRAKKWLLDNKYKPWDNNGITIEE